MFFRTQGSQKITLKTIYLFFGFSMKKLQLTENISFLFQKIKENKICLKCVSEPK